MDALMKKVAAIGIPALVLIVAIEVTGLAGAAAITAALAALGPGGILGGILFLGLIGLAAHTIAEYGMEAVVKAVVKELLKKNSKEEMIAKVKHYPITRGLKLKTIEYINHFA